jgi:hypothetical protein
MTQTFLLSSRNRGAVSSGNVDNVVPSSPIIVTLMMEALSSSETSVLTNTKRHNIPENGIFLVTAVKISNIKYSEI